MKKVFQRSFQSHLDKNVRRGYYPDLKAVQNTENIFPTIMHKTKLIENYLSTRVPLNETLKPISQMPLPLYPDSLVKELERVPL